MFERAAVAVDDHGAGDTLDLENPFLGDRRRRQAADDVQHDFVQVGFSMPFDKQVFVSRVGQQLFDHAGE